MHQHKGKQVYSSPDHLHIPEGEICGSDCKFDVFDASASLHMHVSAQAAGLVAAHLRVCHKGLRVHDIVLRSFTSVCVDPLYLHAIFVMSVAILKRNRKCLVSSFGTSAAQKVHVANSDVVRLGVLLCFSNV